MPAADSRQLVVFTLAGEPYALGIEQVQEIIRYQEPRSVASPLEWVRGVISLRGRIIPVYDLGARLGAPAGCGEGRRIVIAELGAETAGLIVDAVQEVLTVDAAQVQPAPLADTTLVESIVRVGDRLIALLTPDSVCPAPAPEVVALPELSVAS